MKYPLTEKQQAIYDFLKIYMEKYRMPPTRREIGSAFEFSPSAAHQHLAAIQRKGWISFVPNISRGIRLA